jgi:hypothetical protein
MSPQNSCLGVFVLVVTWLWIIALVFGVIIAQLAISSLYLFIPGWNYVMLQIGMGVFLALPLLPLAIFWRKPRYRAIFQTWLLACVYVIFLAPVHLLPANTSLIQAIFRTFLTYAFLFLVIQLPRNASNKFSLANVKSQLRNIGWIISILIAALFAYPWLALGALGSPLDTIFQVIFGFSLGLAVIFTTHHYLEPVFYLPSTITKSEYTVGGFSIGTTVLIMVAGTAFPYGGMQLLLMICVPTLGWAIFALYKISRKDILDQSSKKHWLSQTLLLGLAISAPLAFIDPDELILISSANTGDILQWALSSAGLSALIGLAASLIISIFVFTKWLNRDFIQKRKTLLGVLSIITLILGGLLYINLGQPGFYGDGMFVILKNQADTSESQNISSYIARREFVYETLTDHANQTQHDLLEIFDNLGINYTPYYLVNGFQFQGGPILRIWLESRPEVDRVLANPWLRPLPSPLPIASGFAQAPTGPSWNLKSINANRVWDELGITGVGIVIGQSDSGIDGEHQELSKSYRGVKRGHDYNWFDPWNNTTKPTDIDGHGTHSLGIIVGQQVGVAPGASWYGCVNLARNLGNISLYLDCMQFMLAPFPIGENPFVQGDPSLGAHISNNSWGCPPLEGCDSDALLPAVRALRDAGIFVVASAGNDGPRCESLSVPIPIYKEAYAVGSIDQFGQLSSFSSIGPVSIDGSGRTKPDITAPGEEVLSAMPKNSYGYRSGTSFAGPHVAGVVALIWSANPMLIGDIDKTEEILAQTAQPYTGNMPACEGASLSPSTAVGYGIVDAYAAVKMALESK